MCQLVCLSISFRNFKKWQCTHTSIYICCRVKAWSNFGLLLSQKVVQGCVKNWPKIFCLFSPSFIVFFGILKSQIVCRGARIFLLQSVRVSKKGFQKRHSAFCVFVFSVLEKEKEKRWKHGKGNFQKKTETVIFGWLWEVPFWEGASKGALLSVMLKSCVRLKIVFFSVFSKHSFAEIKECKLNKTEIHPKLGVCCQHAKGVFCLFVFLVLCLFFSLFLFLFWENAPKRLFPATLEVFLLCSPKNLSLKSLSSSYSVCFPGFFCCLPFQNSIFFLLLFVDQPLCAKHVFGFLHFCLSFVSVCLFLWNILS